MEAAVEQFRKFSDDLAEFTPDMMSDEANAIRFLHFLKQATSDLQHWQDTLRPGACQKLELRLLKLVRNIFEDHFQNVPEMTTVHSELLTSMRSILQVMKDDSVFQNVVDACNRWQSSSATQTLKDSLDTIKSTGCDFQVLIRLVHALQGDQDQGGRP